MVDANKLGGSKRFNVANLAPHEQEAVKEQGLPIDADGFVDIPIDEDPVQSQVDPKAEKRNDAIQDLMAAVDQQEEPTTGETTPPEAAPSPTLNLDELFALKEENKALRKELEEYPHQCPRCKWEVKERPQFMPTDQQRRDFLKSVLSGKPYEQEIPLFDGEMTVKFRTRRASEEQLINAAVAEAHLKDLIGTSNMLYSHLRRFNFAFSYMGTSDSAREEMSKEKTDFEGLLARTDKYLGDVPSQSREILYELFDQFTATVSHLIAGATDQDFYKRTE